MGSFLHFFNALKKQDQPFVMASLVRLKGSAYRRLGARMVLGPGPTVGSLSAGCLEADLKVRLEGMLIDSKTQRLTFKAGEELAPLWGLSMGCAQEVEVLLERVGPQLPPWMHFCAQQLSHRKNCALATVIEGELLGDRFAFDERGHGLLPMDSGLSRALHRASQACFQNKKTEEVEVLFQGKPMHVLMEYLEPPLELWIYGAGELGQTLCEMASRADWSVVIADHRPFHAANYPEARQCLSGAPENVLKGSNVDGRSAALVASHVLERDARALKCFVDRGFSYIGVLGNRNRLKSLLQYLKSMDIEISDEQVKALYHPVGLDLGQEGSGAVALSILAEAQCVLSQRQPVHLRDKRGAIH